MRYMVIFALYGIAMMFLLVQIAEMMQICEEHVRALNTQIEIYRDR